MSNRSPLSNLSSAGMILTAIVVIVMLVLGYRIVSIQFNLGPLAVELAKPTDDEQSASSANGTSYSQNTTIPDAPRPPTPEPDISYPPVILDVTERLETTNSGLVIYKDIHFQDKDGDAYIVKYDIVSAGINGIYVENDSINASSNEQMSGAYVTGTWECGTKSKYKVVLRARIWDYDGNKSDPTDITFNCSR